MAGPPALVVRLRDVKVPKELSVKVTVSGGRPERALAVRCGIGRWRFASIR